MEWNDILDVAQLLANIATIGGIIAIFFLFKQHNHSKDLRNLQLMQRCIDNFRTWYSNPNKKVDFFYLELLNEELFYFQKGLIEEEIALEWIEGILDFIIIKGKDEINLNKYYKQEDVEKLDQWPDNKYFFFRIYYFTHIDLGNEYVLPVCKENESEHHFKKRQLAKELYKHIRNYKY